MTTQPAAARTSPEPPRRTRPSPAWLAATIACLAVLAATGTTLGAGSLTSVTATFDETSPWAVPAASFFLVLTGALLLWGLGVVLVARSPVWARRDRWGLVLLWPAAVGLTVLTSFVVSGSFAVNLLVALVQLFAALLAVAAVVRLWFRTTAGLR